jgi:NTP pyrophosphatase (non-canonical NTP hydrolase)
VFDDQRLIEIVDALRAREGGSSVIVSALMLAEETGEAVQAVRRNLGHARRSASPVEVCQELADVVISAAIIARLMGVDLAGAIDAKLGLGVR